MSKRTNPFKKTGYPKNKYQKTGKKQSLSTYSNNRKHYVKRHVNLGLVGLSGINDTSGGFGFRLADVPGNAELISLYDQFKICSVKLVFYPKQTQTARVDTSDNVRGNSRFGIAVDLNDITPPATFDDLRQYESCKVTPLVDRHEVYVNRPLYLNPSGQNVNDWLSTSASTTTFNGVKWFGEATGITTATQFTYQVEAVYYLGFKNIK